MSARRLPQVAIVGRPNVGKSTLLNRLIGERRAIVDDTPGVTRDRLYYDVVWNGQKVKVVDTGGFVQNSDDPFGALINEQVDQALAESDVVVLVVDGPQGVHPLDEAMADRIRRSGKRALLAINKIDDPNQHPYVHSFYSLGIGETPIGLSALHGSIGVGDLLDEVLANLPEGGAVVEESEDPPVRIALVGRPNVGKSSILNKLLGYQRSIVSDISGTTRDAIDAELAWKGQKFHLVDTAGIRKKSKVDYGVELFAVDRSIRAMREAEVTLLVVDAVEGLTDQDKSLINASHDAGNALVLVVNKWDLVPEKSTKSTVEYEKRLLRDAPHAHFAQVMFISALTGQRIHRVLEAAQFAAENHRRRVTTHLVNRLIGEAIMLTPPPHIKSRQLKILYSTQIKASPPTFVLFVNSAKLLKDTYRRYLEKHLRANIELTGTPIRFIVRERKKDTTG